LKPLGSYYKAT